MQLNPIAPMTCALSGIIGYLIGGTNGALYGVASFLVISIIFLNQPEIIIMEIKLIDILACALVGIFGYLIDGPLMGILNIATYFIITSLLNLLTKESP